MERTLIKTAIYSFIISFSALLVLVNRAGTSEDFNGMRSSWEIPYPDFFFMILEYSIMITFIMVIIVFLIKRFKKRKR
ncbi:hypothetical protein [Cytobacillus solani]|uniref:Uncharacterized protein n=1 Tax=Cytobacillus solani TaxID=1637975 RepID=A0A0Q3QNA0_9BACI|nr:hypothetical protein [Cytobacillus solani]KQL19096.1 hypothetical protein AN957_11220 [Cytobacillus solani]